MPSAIHSPSKEILTEFCRRHHICKRSNFGSAVRDDFGPESDIDILVEFETGQTSGLCRFIDIQDELSDLFGCSVDLRTPLDLSKYIREEVLELMEVKYGG